MAHTKRRRRQSLGDVLDDRVVSINRKRASVGQKQLAKRAAEARAKRELCSEGESSYCPTKRKGGGKKRRPPKGYRVSSWRKALTVNGKFKPACRFHAGRAICKAASKSKKG